MKQWIFPKVLTLLLMTAVALLFLPTTASAQADEREPASVEAGVLIVQVEPASPAAEAGLVRGDIVLRVDGAAVDDALTLRQTIGDLESATTVMLTVLHGDEERTVELTLGERDGRPFLGVVPYIAVTTLAAPTAPAASNAPSALPLHRRLLPAVPAEGALMESANMSVTLTIVDVMDDSPAADAGLQTDDLITAINGAALTQPRALADAVQALAPGDPLTLTVQPADADAEAADVVITLGEHPDHADQPYLGVRFASMVQITRDAQGVGPRERTMRRFQFRAPHFAQPGAKGQQECRCREEGDRGQFFSPHDEDNFIFPFLRRFFWWKEAPAHDDVIIFRGAPGEVDIMIDPQWATEEGTFFVMPELTAPAVPATPIPVEVVYVDDLI